MLVNIGLLLAIIAFNSSLKLLEPPPGKTNTPIGIQLYAIIAILLTVILGVTLYQAGVEATARLEKAQSVLNQVDDYFNQRP